VILVTYRPDPWGGWTGARRWAALKRELALDDRMTDLLNVLFERGGVPPLALKATPQGTANTAPMRFSQEDIDAITGSFAQKYGGSDNWHKPMFLGGLEVERIGLDLGEMLFPQIREHIELHVCTAFGVPAGMIGTSAGLARNTYSNAATDVTKYYDGTIAPLWARLDGAFTRGLLREFDPAGTLDMNFDTSEIGALQEDEEPKWTHATSALHRRARHAQPGASGDWPAGVWQGRRGAVLAVQRDGDQAHGFAERSRDQAGAAGVGARAGRGERWNW
jgi:phage portal protein BeeE